MKYLQADITTRALASDELLPSVSALADNIESVPRKVKF
jgi:DNA-binding transcriptional regulator YhcF (GntR family)